MSNQEAVKALELASSYIDEVESVIDQIESDHHQGNKLLRTLDLAKKQADRAKNLDEDAIYKHDNATIYLARILGNKAIIENIAFGKRTAALETLKKALELSEDLDPNQYAIGAIYAEIGDKERALFHLKKAIDLAPENVEYRKLYDRVENTSTTKMKFGAFQGSWKVLLILTAIGIMMALGGGSVPAFIFFGIAFSYWIWKSR
jgi:tetratricopeptide (TPR) repeat protein